MRCLNPIKAAHSRQGGITFSGKQAEPGMDPFELECRKCLPCRLNIAREKSIRAIHEARMHNDNIFLTLTYREEDLESPILQYSDFQNFMKRLRKKYPHTEISYMVTGEYGDKNKRPHWHALIFNFVPPDAKPEGDKTELGHQKFTSQIIHDLWGKGKHDFGSVTIDSASYVARYAAKKLTHGHDDDHVYHPIHKTSSKHAIGKRWIEQHWERTFTQGNVVLPNGQTTKIPRYYVDWLKKNKPDVYVRYVTEKREEIQNSARLRARKEELRYLSECLTAHSQDQPRPITGAKMQITILKQKFKRLQEKLKL